MSITCENTCENRPVVASDFMLVVGIYVLYGLSYFTLFPALAGLIIAYIKLGDCHPVMQSHYRFQIRTFWIGVLYVVIAIPLCFVLIGFLLLIWVDHLVVHPHHQGFSAGARARADRQSEILAVRIDPFLTRFLNANRYPLRSKAVSRSIELHGNARDTSDVPNEIVCPGRRVERAGKLTAGRGFAARL